MDVMRSTHTDLDVAQEKRIDDCWNVDGNTSLSDSWTGFTRFTLLNETPPKGYVVWWEADENSNDITSRSHMAWRLDENWKSRSMTGKARMDNRQTKTRKCQKKLEDNLMIRVMMSTKTSFKKATRKLDTQMAAAMPCKREFSKASSCITEAHVSTRLRIESAATRIHDGRIAGIGKNTIVYNLFARQLKPREGSKVTLWEK